MTTPVTDAAESVGSGRRRRLSPDALAALTEERSFLLKSLDDLDAEHAAGDMDEADYRTLHDDYTRRAAEVIRAIDEQRAAFAAAPGISRGRRVMAFTGVLIIAALAGLLLARSVGFRTTGSATGDVAESVAGLLAEAEALTIEGEWVQAIEVYDELLDAQPSNVEALTYKGWLQFQTGEGPAGAESLEDAVATDPNYAPARVFRALIFRTGSRYDEAAEELAVLDGLEVDPGIAQLLDASNLRAEVLAEQLRDRYRNSADALTMSDIGMTAEVAVDAARILDVDGNAPLAIRVRDAVLEADPNHVGALIDQGRRLAATEEIVTALPETAARGLELLDRALEREPESIDALLWRAVGRAMQGDPDGARDDVAALEAMDLPAEAEELLNQIQASLGE